MEPRQPASELVLYQTEDGRTKIECRFDEGSIWLSQRQIAELFGVTVPTVDDAWLASPHPQRGPR